jgi:hypothetical protein
MGLYSYTLLLIPLGHVVSISFIILFISISFLVAFFFSPGSITTLVSILKELRDQMVLQNAGFNWLGFFSSRKGLQLFSVSYSHPRRILDLDDDKFFASKGLVERHSS